MRKTWPTVPLAEVLTDRQEVPDPNSLISGEVRIVSKIGFNDGLIQLRTDVETKTGMILIRPGDLLVSGINAAKGAIAIYGEDNTKPITATIHYGAYIPNKDRVDIRYLWWLLRSGTFRDLLVEYLPSGIKTELKAKRLLPVPVPLPPLKEQHRIVKIIDSIAQKIQTAKNLRKQSRTELDTLLHSYITRLCYNPKNPIVPFGQIILETKNGIYKPPLFWSRGVPCIRMYNIEGPSLNTVRLQLLDVTPDELETYGCRPGDLIFNRVNSAELVGKTGLITAEYPKATFESKNMRIRINTTKVLPFYAALILNAPPTRAHYRRVLKQQCGMATLNQNHIKSIPFPLPTVDEQRRIVAYLDNLQAKINKLKELQHQTGAELDAFLPSILDKAFKGEL